MIAIGRFFCKWDKRGFQCCISCKNRKPNSILETMNVLARYLVFSFYSFMQRWKHLLSHLPKNLPIFRKAEKANVPPFNRCCGFTYPIFDVDTHIPDICHRCGFTYLIFVKDVDTHSWYLSQLWIHIPDICQRCEKRYNGQNRNWHIFTHTFQWIFFSKSVVCVKNYKYQVYGYRQGKYIYLKYLKFQDSWEVSEGFWKEIGFLNSDFWIIISEFWFLKSHFWILTFEFWLLNSDLLILNSDFLNVISEAKLLKSDFWIHIEFNVSLDKSMIFSAMAMAMRIYRTLCVLALKTEYGPSLVFRPL